MQEGALLAREKQIDFILAVGGGSVIDCCKIVSAQTKLDADIWDYEYAEHKLPTQFIPMGAVVTAFGTGAEMNNGAVITNTDKMLKSALWGAFYDFAILDPAYTMTMPLKQVISGAFDSLSHSMETYLGSPRTVNLSDEINEATQRNIIRNIRATLKHREDLRARSELVWAAAMAENGILKIGKVTEFPVPHAGTPTGRLHRLQPRPGIGGAASGLVPALSAGGRATVRPAGHGGLGRRSRGEI